MNRADRLVPERPFPPYTFVPGKSPHPNSDSNGHNYGVEPQQPAPIDPARWSESKPYLYGLDLFNGRYYWEAHEAWEGLWLAAGRTGATADFLKALIQLAAAGVKHAQGMSEGVTRHARRAAELARAVGADKTFFLGLDVNAVAAIADTIAQQDWPGEGIVLVPIIDDGNV